MSFSLPEAFKRHLAQTSPQPLGVQVSRARGSWIETADGRRILDLISGIGVSALGHGHPAVLEALRRAAEKHLHVMVYGEFVQAAQVELAVFLAERLPGPLEVVYFTSSGAEAVEGSIKLARKATGRTEVVCFSGAYHGDTTGALALGGDAEHRRPFEPLLPGVIRLPFGEGAALSQITERTALVVVEPIQAEAGVRLPPAGYLQAVRRRCDEVGALLAFDEVQVGLGRVGRWFACEREGVAPDIMILAKALGGGLPLGAFCGAAELMRALQEDPPLSHLTTFGGHPLCCATGLAALQTIEREGLLERAQELGRRLVQGLQRRIGGLEGFEVWGVGLLAGMRCPSPKIARGMIQSGLERGLLLGDCLHAPEIVKLAPPLTLSDDELDEAVGKIAALAEELS